MTDRLEEVLEQLEDEQEDREVLALVQAAPPFPGQAGAGREQGEEPGGVRSDGAAAPSGTPLPAEQAGQARPGADEPEAPRRRDGTGGEVWAAGVPERSPGGTRVLWPEEGAGQPRGGEAWEAGRLTAGPSNWAGAGTSRTRPGRDSVPELYRQVSRAVWAAGAAAPAAQAVTVTEQRAAPAAGLTVGELDRAVRRDSRRYDGGMTLY